VVPPMPPQGQRHRRDQRNSGQSCGAGALPLPAPPAPPVTCSNTGQDRLGRPPIAKFFTFNAVTVFDGWHPGRTHHCPHDHQRLSCGRVLINVVDPDIGLTNGDPLRAHPVSGLPRYRSTTA
jgi:hypothetical protein